MTVRLQGRFGPENGIEHTLICGDNLTVMSDPSDPMGLRRGKTDLIYIDPPYNTGKQMGRYRDRRTHDEWIGFMRPRLELAHSFLSPRGIIAISIGEAEEAHLKLLCREIFGEANQLATIIWQSKHTVANDKQGISTQTEYIVVFAIDAALAQINPDPLRAEYVESTYRNPDSDPRGLWRGGVQLFKQKNPRSYTVTSPSGVSWTRPWNYSESQWQDVLVRDNLLWWGRDGDLCPVKKVFLKDSKGTPIRNLWLGSEVGYTADGGDTIEQILGNRNEFLYPKPVQLMRRILQTMSQPDSSVMDFFAGSGTFGQAVLEMNHETGSRRQFTLITNNENDICQQVTLPRLQKVIGGYTGKDGIHHDGTGGQLAYWLDEASQ